MWVDLDFFDNLDNILILQHVVLPNTLRLVLHTEQNIILFLITLNNGFHKP